MDDTETGADSCECCGGEEAAYWEDEAGGVWEIACPNCVGYLAVGGRKLAVYRGVLDERTVLKLPEKLQPSLREEE
jgi:hypothetical protein